MALHTLSGCNSQNPNLLVRTDHSSPELNLSNLVNKGNSWLKQAPEMIESTTDTLRDLYTSDSVLGREEELLICCGCYSIGPDRVGRVQELLGGQPDWERLFQIARLHRVLPLLYRNLRQIRDGLVPQAFLTRLRQHHLGNTSRNLLLIKELLSLLSLLEKAGIPAVPFKGPMLASLAYGNTSWREFGDLDILVPREHALKGVELLTSQGYLKTYTMSEQEETNYLDSGCEFTLIHERSTVIVDLHWRFFRGAFSFPFDIGGLWRQLEELSVAGRPIPAMPLEETLLLHCVHGSKHQWERLEWISILAQLIRVHERRIDWKKLQNLARRLGSERMLLLGLALARRFFGAPVPEELMHRASSHPGLDSLTRWVVARLFFEGDEHLLGIQKHIFHVKMREHWRDRIPYFMLLLGLVRGRLTPNQRDRDLVPLPPLLCFLHYLIRPIRLCWEYGAEGVASLHRLLQRFHSS